MKAFLLAAGLGTRLKPITDEIPKCLVNICGTPLLGWWIKLFEHHNIDDVLINLHHLPEKVVEYIKTQKTKVNFHFFYEEKLLGSAGTLRENKNFVAGEECFFICYADNLTNYNLKNFLSFHKEIPAHFSMALFNSDNPTSKGIAVLDEQNRIIEFEEKPARPKSNIANAGMYISSPVILEKIPVKEIADIGFDLLPLLKSEMYGWQTEDYLIDIGTPSDMIKAEKEWNNILKGETK
ncbi:MAG: nucleotidyltransferase family protein [Ignavibacteriales bacterium]|nr:MAG: nucleotidyltransferase family protein [Ignavibacteriales bacterium]